MLIKNSNNQMFIAFLIWLCFNSCANEKIRTNTVLKIDNLEVSEYTFQREISKVFSTKNINNEVNTKWRKEFLENCLLIEDAYTKKLDTIETLKEKIEVVSDIMMVQQYGYLWQKMVSPVVDDFMKITKEKINKREKLYYFDYIACYNIDSFETVFNRKFEFYDTFDYQSVKKDVAKYSFLRSGYWTLQWPFPILSDSRDILGQQKEKQLSDPLSFSKGKIILYLDRIETCNLTSKQYESFPGDLQLVIEKEINKKKDEEMFLKGKPCFVHDNLKKVIDFINEGQDILKFYDDVILMNYIINGKLHNVTFHDFKIYLKYNPYSYSIKNSIELESALNNYFFADYLKAEAFEIGLYSNKKFLLDKEYYKNKTILNEYIRKEFFAKIKIDSLQIIDYYNSNRSCFVIDTCLNVSVFYFSDKKTAENNFDVIAKIMNEKSNELILTQFSEVKELSHCDFSEIVNPYKTYLNEKVVRQLHETNDNSLFSEIIRIKGEYVIIYKNTTQFKQVLPLNMVDDYINNVLFNEQLDNMRNKRIGELKDIYQVKINKTGVSL